MDKNRVHVASALTGILGNQKADALAGKSTSKEKTGKDRVVQYMWQGAVMRRRMPTAFKSQRRRSWKETRLSSSAITTDHHHIYSAWTSQSVQPTWTTARISRAWSWWAETCARSPAVCVRHLVTCIDRQADIHQPLCCCCHYYMVQMQCAHFAL